MSELLPAQTVIADIETTAITYDVGGVMILPETIHYLIAEDFERGIIHTFGPEREDIARGVRWLESSQLVIFHNGRGFDELVLECQHNLEKTGPLHFLDSMILCQLFYSNVKEEEDFLRFEKHKAQPNMAPAHRFTGDLIGRHSLEAWGLRLRKPVPKMDYKALCKKHGIVDPWGAPNPYMLEYAIQDVKTLSAVYRERLMHRITPDMRNAIIIEHYMAELMLRVKNTGIKFDKKRALKLVAELTKRADEIAKQVQEEFPPRFEPVKWVYRPLPIDMPEMNDEEYAKFQQWKNAPVPQARSLNELREKFDERVKENDPYSAPDDATRKAREETIERYREVYERERAEFTLNEEMTTIVSDPARRKQQLTLLMYTHGDNPIYRPRFNLPDGYVREMFGEITNSKVNRTARLKDGTILYNVVKGQEFVKCHWAELNPNSRPQITRRLLELGWVPDEFTDADNPSTSEAELLKIEEQFPAAANLAKYLMIQKRLGAVESGEKAWLKLLDNNNFIHPTIRPCSTVTFRATHNDPNISQVPSVRKVKMTDADGNVVLDDKGNAKMRPGIGEEGKWGYDCRACFTVPDGWTFVGADLAGIELRCWAHYLMRYDNGRLADLVLNADVHEENRLILGFADRRKAKEWLYAMMYGAGDEKLGFTIDPLASISRQKELGRSSRVRFMRGMTGYEQLNELLMDGVKRGWVKGLDGRRCPVRKQHAALNTLLQSAGAIISKYWMMYAMNILENEYDLKWGYDGDFTLMIYSHDELDFACKPEHVDKIKDACIRGAELAQKKLEFRLPVGVDVMPGPNWAECH